MWIICKILFNITPTEKMFNVTASLINKLTKMFLGKIRWSIHTQIRVVIHIFYNKKKNLYEHCTTNGFEGKYNLNLSKPNPCNTNAEGVTFSVCSNNIHTKFSMNVMNWRYRFLSLVYLNIFNLLCTTRDAF